MKFINNIHDALKAYIESHFRADFMKTHPDEDDVPNHFYYDEKEKSCLNCPSKYFTRRPGSIGRNKCVQIPLCDPFAFKRKISPYCNQETNKFDEI